jgi:hypothetical protein
MFFPRLRIFLLHVWQPLLAPHLCYDSIVHAAWDTHVISHLMVSNRFNIQVCICLCPLGSFVVPRASKCLLWFLQDSFVSLQASVKKERKKGSVNFLTVRPCLRSVEGLPRYFVKPR